MDRPTTIALRIGDWRLDQQLGLLTRGAQSQRLEARTLRLLVYLANRSGDTVSIEELLDNVWSGVIVTQDSVYQAITSLRRLLGDEPRNPTYIATVPRLGYRMVARVSPWEEEPLVPESHSPGEPPERAAVAEAGREPAARRRHGPQFAILIVLLAVAAMFALHDLTTPGLRTVAVLPFLDLTTQEMKEEYFADGMTEELINRLSELPGFEVPAPAASFYYKNKDIPPAKIARELHVNWLLDGSLRESGDTLRVSARLVRASDGFVSWAETFDRPKADRLAIQDEIATKVAGAVKEGVAGAD